MGRHFDDALKMVKKIHPKLDERLAMAVAAKIVAALPKSVRDADGEAPGLHDDR